MVLQLLPAEITVASKADQATKRSSDNMELGLQIFIKQSGRFTQPVSDNLITITGNYWLLLIPCNQSIEPHELFS